jgi:spore coat polysaccharide biosynthesis protein SpsF (cytidylyltransferase family)
MCKIKHFEGENSHNKNNSQKIIAIIVARLDSKRLPEKALKEVNGFPLIYYVISRAKRISGIDTVVLATSNRSLDDPLANYANSQDISLYRGSCDDLALRMLCCAKEFKADYFIRLNGDSPFLDPGVIAEGIAFCTTEQFDLITNLVGRTFPYGVAVEIVRTAAFEKAYKNMTRSEEHENVTIYLYEHSMDFRIKSITSKRSELSLARMVVDTREDFELFERLVFELGDDVFTAGYAEIAELYFKQKRGK